MCSYYIKGIKSVFRVNSKILYLTHLICKYNVPQNFLHVTLIASIDSMHDLIITYVKVAKVIKI